MATNLVLVKKDQIDAVITAVETRQLRVSSQPKAGIYEMFDKALATLEAQTTMRVQDGVAVIPVNGAISFDDPFAAFFGETTIKTISDNLDKALADDSVHSILLQVNSPGGYVTGVEALSDKLYAARGKKRLYAHTEGMAASAAYWIASAADRVFLGSGTAEVGSIGVYLVHFDYSTLLTNAGIKVTEVTAGEFKGLGSPYTELSKQDQKLLQADVDYIYTRFVEAVARNRGISTEEVLKSANGLTFFGADAVAKSLADGISTHQEVIAMTKEQEDKAKAEAAAAEQKAKDEAAVAAKTQAEAGTLAAAQATAAAAQAELAQYKAKEAAENKAKIENEAQAAYKSAFGRDATEEEKQHYATLTETGRKLHLANLKETADNRSALAKKAGLFTEIAGEGAAANDGEDLLLHAAQSLGHIAKS